MPVWTPGYKGYSKPYASHVFPRLVVHVLTPSHPTSPQASESRKNF